MPRLVPLVLLAGAALAGCGGGEEPVGSGHRPAPALRAAASRSHAAAPAPHGRHLIARLERPVLLRASPRGRVVARLGARTQFGTRTVLGVLARRPGWLEVVAPERRNGRPGWIASGRAQLSGTDYALYADRSAHELTLRHGRRVVRRVRIAVGRPANPTPTGRFAVTDKLRPARADSPYGCCILALSGHQTKLVRGWPGGDRLAIHNTPQTQSIGKAVSLGCMRGGRRDLQFLMRRVPLGTPVFIRA